MTKMWIAAGEFSHLDELEKRQNTNVILCVVSPDRQTAIARLVQWVVENFRGVVWDNTDAEEAPSNMFVMQVTELENDS